MAARGYNSSTTTVDQVAPNWTVLGSSGFKINGAKALAIHLSNSGSADISDCRIRIAYNDTVGDAVAYPLLNTVASQRIADKLVNTTGECSLVLPQLDGTIYIEMQVAAGNTDIDHVIAAVDDVNVDRPIIDGELVSFEEITETATNPATINVDNSDTVTYTIEHTYKTVTIENISDELVYFALGQNTNNGARGLPLGRCADDGAGGYIIGTGGSRTITKFKGDVYFYTAAAGGASVRVIAEG